MKRILPLCGILSLLSFSLTAQKEFDDNRGTRHWMMFSDASNALYHHLAGEAYPFLDERADAMASIHSLEDWQERQRQIRESLAEAAGPFPERTPLNARITRTIDKDGYRVEHILYESRPGYYVTSSLFLPAGLKRGEKAPAVIYCSGHSDSGYRSRVYQHVILNLVSKGFIVFAFDPAGQGERLQYYDPGAGGSRLRYPTHEHSYPGAQLFMTGNTLAGYFIWDGIRAVDYLLSRKEVDQERIGITGRSGGGTQSAYIAAFDDRIKAAAPENYITNFTRLYQSMGPQDAEQNFFYGIRRGLDMGDLLLVRAPEPTLMITTTRDMFPIQGAMETAEEVSKLYEAYGKEDNFRMVTDDAPHASTEKNREAMYAFFQKHLDNPGDPSDEEVPLLNADELRVTATGQVSTSLDGETIFSLNKKDAEKRMAKLDDSRKDLPGYLTEVMKSAKELSGYREPGTATAPIFTGRIQRDGYTVEKYFVKGEGDYVIPYLLMKPEKPAGKALIYLHPAGKTAASAEGGEMEWFVKKGFTVLAPDLIGTGEMGPGAFRGDSYIDSVSYNTWFASMLIGRSIAGIRAGDVARLAKLLKKAYSPEEIYGLARKEMAPVLLHAAAFDADIKSIALIGPCPSYRSIVMNREYDPAFLYGTVPGSVGSYDLPDLAAGLAPRKLLLFHATDGTGGSAKGAAEDLSVIEASYRYRKAASRLQVVPFKGPGMSARAPEGAFAGAPAAASAGTPTEAAAAASQELKEALLKWMED